MRITVWNCQHLFPSISLIGYNEFDSRGRQLENGEKKQQDKPLGLAVLEADAPLSFSVL